MLLEQYEKIDEAELLRLCKAGCPESSTLDFKRDLPGISEEGREKDKKEFLKDVCAFANSDGGDLVYGIAEEHGMAKEPVPITAENFDDAKRRLGQILEAGLEPRVPGLLFHQIPVAGGYVLLVRVPASFDGPHRFSSNNREKQFVMRNHTHTSELNYAQLRAAFDRTATLAERARTFR